MRKTIISTLLFLFITCPAWAGDLTGIWVFEATIDATEAGEGIKKQELEVEIEQVGDDVTFSFGNAVLKGKLKGNTLHVTGSYEEAGVIKKDLTFEVSGDSMQGGGNWTYETDDLKVKGTEKLVGEKVE